MLYRTLVSSLLEWFAVVKLTHGLVMGRTLVLHTFGIGCHNKSNNRLGVGPILGQVSAEGR